MDGRHEDTPNIDNPIFDQISKYIIGEKEKGAPTGPLEIARIFQLLTLPKLTDTCKELELEDFKLPAEALEQIKKNRDSLLPVTGDTAPQIIAIMMPALAKIQSRVDAALRAVPDEKWDALMGKQKTEDRDTFLRDVAAGYVFGVTKMLTQFGSKIGSDGKPAVDTELVLAINLSTWVANRGARELRQFNEGGNVADLTNAVIKTLQNYNSGPCNSVLDKCGISKAKQGPIATLGKGMEDWDMQADAAHKSAEKERKQPQSSSSKSDSAVLPKNKADNKQKSSKSLTSLKDSSPPAESSPKTHKKFSFFGKGKEKPTTVRVDPYAAEKLANEGAANAGPSSSVVVSKLHKPDLSSGEMPDSPEPVIKRPSPRGGGGGGN